MGEDEEYYLTRIMQGILQQILEILLNFLSSPARPEPTQARGSPDDPGEGRAPGSGL